MSELGIEDRVKITLPKLCAQIRERIRDAGALLPRKRDRDVPPQWERSRECYEPLKGSGLILELPRARRFWLLRKNVFSRIKNFWKSMGEGELVGGSKGKGKSGALFFTTADGRFVMKTVREDELELCLSEEFLGPYQEYLQSAGGRASLLPKFLAMVKVTVVTEGKGRGSEDGRGAAAGAAAAAAATTVLSGSCAQTIAMIVMPNILHLSKGRYDKTFDLKGSSKNRFTPAAESSLRGAVLKDLNFLNSEVSVRKIMGAHAKESLRQVERDAMFLSRQGIIDYSLLLAVGVAEDAGVSATAGHGRKGAARERDAVAATTSRSTSTTDDLSILHAAAVRKYSMDKGALRIPETFAGTLEANVTSFEHETETTGATFYHVQVSMKRHNSKTKSKWKVKHRYSAFALLRQNLLKELRSTNAQETVRSLTFPKKTLFRPVHDDVLSKERMEVLNAWLHCIVVVVFKGMVGRVPCLRRFLAEEGWPRMRRPPSSSKVVRAVRGVTGTSSAVKRYNSAVRNELVAFGIIDILQKFTTTKRFEHALKTISIPTEAADTVSVQNPDKYCERFTRFMEIVFDK